VVTLPTLPNLDGLIGLARQDGVDVRPTLVRVLTDLYVQKPSHTREEEHRYTELVLLLIATVDVPTRAAVARKLASYAHAPRLVVRRLARDVFEVAEPVLKFSPCLTSDDLMAIICDFGSRYAEAIGARDQAQVQPREKAASPAMAEAERAAPVAAAADAAARVAVEQPPAGGGLAPRSGDSRRGAIGTYFLAAGPTERRLLLANLQGAALTTSERGLPGAAEKAIGELEAAALERRPDDFVGGLERSLRVSGATAQAIAADEGGEPIVVAAKALGMPPDVFLRVLLFLNPLIGHSVERVFDLVSLYDQLSPQAALRIVSSWQDAFAGERRAGRHQPLHWDDETRSARRTFGEHARHVVQPAGGEQRPAASEQRPRAQRTT